MPSNSTNRVTIATTSLFDRSISGSSIFFASTSSSMLLSLLTKTPILAHPRSLNHPSTISPRPRVSKVIGPENKSAVYELNAVTY